MGQTKIEWTERTWNPIRGCSKLSEGCGHCYAAIMAHRFSGKGKPFEGLTAHTSKGVNWTGKIMVVEEQFAEPYKWRKPQMVFVNSMSDLFHENVSIEVIRRIFRVMNETPQHKYQVLTKRPERLLKLNGEFTWTPNIWMGVTVENQKVLKRIDLLLGCSAHVKYLSCEPLLEPLDLSLDGIDWVICGGESGPGARPMKPEWVRRIRDDCVKNKVPFFFKQWGGLKKKQAGRTLDGKIWDEMPVEH